MLFYLSLLSHFSYAATTSVKPVNDKCPFSMNEVDSAQVLSFGVCCTNCMKKASSNLLDFVRKTLPGNKVCSFSAKPVRKTLMIGFCCSKCKKKASL